MPRTRRELIRSGALGVAVAAAGVAPSTADAADPLAGANGDTAILGRLVMIEQLIEFAYAHLLEAGGLSAAAAGVFKNFLSHEQAHVRLLCNALMHRGSVPRPPPTGVRVASPQLA